MTLLLITGGTGYLGSVLVRQASAQGRRSAATYVRQTPPDLPSVAWYPLDLTDPSAAEATLYAIRPTHIIHTAFRQYEPQLREVTALGAGVVARAAAALAAHLVHLSSDVIFNGEAGAPYAETVPPDPITAYGAAKAEAEQLVAAACPSAAIVRTSLIYGFDPPDRQTIFTLEIADGIRTAQLFTDEYRCPIFVEDLAAALLELVDGPFSGILNVAGSETLSRYAFGRLLAQANGRDPDRLTFGTSAGLQPPRPRNCALDTSLARQILHTQLRGVREVVGMRNAEW